MNYDDITDYSKAVRKIIADPLKFSDAVEGMVTLHRTELEIALYKMLGSPNRGVEMITGMLVNEFKLIIIEDEATEILAEEQLPLTLVDN